MDPMSLADRVKEAVNRESQKPALDRWNALIERGAIDSKGRVLLKAPSPMNSHKANPRGSTRRGSNSK